YYGHDVKTSVAETKMIHGDISIEGDFDGERDSGVKLLERVPGISLDPLFEYSSPSFDGLECTCLGFSPDVPELLFAGYSTAQRGG
ncbi:hypothetical protein KIPB_017156, partial [Kipferlia bialata]